jgi:hypothetical protein
MKTTMVGSKVFQPVQITLETPEDVAKFHAMLCFVPLIQSLEIEQFARDSRKVFEPQCVGEVENAEWFDKLVNRMRRWANATA